MATETTATPTPDDRARYEILRKELIQSLNSKRAVDKKLAQIELDIYNLEAKYLTETAAHSGGNIIQGFDGYLKTQNVTRRKAEVHDQDRLFSSSSLSYQKSLQLMGDGEETAMMPEEFVKQTTPGLTTVVVPPAPRAQDISAAQAKKNRDKEYQRRKRANARSTGTLSDEEPVSTSSRRPNKRARLADDD
ncbi:hypothetical protein HGRIS_006476 [Hohenbuehelia grisea]|uniref:Chromatin modification-related protein EAF6 n=1 Tax=Hohenbuehelia grisea TaxID=104357 RepID=A0ABR3K0Z1_9AGAR